MMSAEAREIGISAVSGGSATQNFGGGGSGSRAGTLLSGMAIGSNFVAVVGGGGTSMSVTLWSDGKPTMMNHVGGGIYVVSKGMARCATYYFQVGDDGTRTFPSGDRGMLRFNCNGQPLYAADPKRRPSTRELSANNAAQEPAAAPSSRVADAPSTTAVPKATTSVVAPPVDSATISTMSAGTKAGISVTVVAFMGVLGIAAVVYRRRRHRAAIEQTEFVENYPMSFYRPRSMSEGETSGKDHQSNKFVLRQPALPSIHIDGISEDDTDTDSMPHLAALPTDYSANRPSVISFQHARRSTVQGHLHPNPLGSIDITSPTGHRDSTHSVIDLYAYYRQSIAIRRTSNESVEIMQDRLAASPNGHRSSGFQASPTMETRRVKSFVAESVLDDIDRELDELDVDIVEEEVVVITESDEE